MSEPLCFLDEKGQPTAAGEQLVAWWHDLVDDRGGRAGLRRAQSLDDAILVVAFQRLRRSLLGSWLFSIETLADVALITAELDTNGEPPGKSLATGNHEGMPLSPGRLKLLADAEDMALFLRLLRGALVQVHRRSSLLHTAELVRRWRHPASRLRARRRLVLDYFEVAGDDLLKKG
ncbi:MAG: type I-E CRISPR-associated protein Cse2/CasB [Geminicoccaceae bacterium]